MKKMNNYWFIIEPYVYLNFVKNHVLLYNSLDGSIIETENLEIRALLEELLKRENGGVAFLSYEQYAKKDINRFIHNVRNRFMGDIIDVNLSHRKPVQILPYIEFLNRRNLKGSFFKVDNILQLLLEVTINIDQYTDILGMLSFVRLLPDNIVFNLKINRNMNLELENLLFYLNKKESDKNVLCEYGNLHVLDIALKNRFSYKIFADFPIDDSLWEHSIKILKKQKLPYEFIFQIKCVEDIELFEQLTKRYQIERYDLHPVYTNGNINFFEENVFLTSKDILSVHIGLKDFFRKQVLNENDFGKITIQSNGDVYANVHYPVLGNIYTHSIYWLIQREISEGQSWLRLRNSEPCKQCIYQWLCPSPSDYEIEIGRPNLCNVKSSK